MTRALAGTGSPLRIRLQARLSDLPRVRAAVFRFARGEGVSALQANRIMAAVDEACSNAVRHGHGGTVGQLEVRLERIGSRLRIVVRDHGPGFQLPVEKVHPDWGGYVKARRAGGLGLHFLRRVMDSVTYGPSAAGGNELVLVKRVRPTRRKTV